MVEILKKEQLENNLKIWEFRLSCIKDTIQNRKGKEYHDRENGFKYNSEFYFHRGQELNELNRYIECIDHTKFLLENYEEMNKDFVLILDSFQEFQIKYDGHIGDFENWTRFHNIFKNRTRQTNSKNK